MLSYMVSCCQTWYVSDIVCMFICAFSLRCFFVFHCISHRSPSTVLSVYLSLSFVPAHYITPLDASISLPHLLCFTHSIPTCLHASTIHVPLSP
ncbi:hypothetical protein BDP27DRAFT_1333572 [Rhodocollybia butyracea]|uniref:Uncharacterized protein n=1 Tax=Rhodocollybia butyracea TaxID=206335 RepID=A0A9P5PM00_9AGAR|nr:hypothetical protein BDP27DRAFT_1333572 [Rhodocollybia butyracea]